MLTDVEQQEEFLADADIEVLRDLRRGQRAIVQRDHLDLAHPRTVARGFVTDDEGEGVVPDVVDRGRGRLPGR